MAEIDRCVYCGGYVPEGRLVCYECETKISQSITTKKYQEEREKTSMFTIYSQRLAGYLMQQGFALIAMVKNDGEYYNNFLFANTDELHKSIEEWKKLKSLKNISAKPIDKHMDL